MASSKNVKKKKKDTKQYDFEVAVKKMKSEADKLKLWKRCDWNYGADPQKHNSRLGIRKSLPRLCSHFIREYIPEWIPPVCRLNYCVMSKGLNKICCDKFNLQQYTFRPSLNISSLIKQRFNISPNEQRMVTRCLMREIIDEKTSNCILKVNVNKQYESYESQFYLKRIKQDRLAKSMDITQNEYRMSYAPDILIDIGANRDILMRLTCKESWVGVGFWDLVKWKPETYTNSTDINVIEEPPHSMIHICDSFDIMSKVDISFGFKQNVCIYSICIEVIGTHLTECNGKIVLYKWEKQQNISNCSNNSVDKHQLMPTIGNLFSCNNNVNINKKRDFNDELPGGTGSVVPAAKKRKLN